MKHHFTIPTRDGGKISVTPSGYAYDLHVQDVAGRTTATVTMSASDFASLRAEMGVAA